MQERLVDLLRKYRFVSYTIRVCASNQENTREMLAKLSLKSQTRTLWSHFCSKQWMSTLFHTTHLLSSMPTGTAMRLLKAAQLWVKKMWHIYTMEFHSAIKKNEIVPLAATWMQLMIIILSEISQKEKDICYHLYVESKI